MKRYVCGEKEQIVLEGKGKRLDGEDGVFAMSLGMWNVASHDFHNFSVNSGKPMAAVLVSTQERYRMCMKVLGVDPNTHVVVFYHDQRGSYLGLRVTKCCRTSNGKNASQFNILKISLH